MSRPQCANACLRKRKREPTRAGGPDVGRAKRDTYTPRGATGQHSLPTPRWRSLMLKNASRKPNHKGGNRRKKPGTTFDGNGATPENAGGEAWLQAKVKPPSRLGAKAGASSSLNLAIPEMQSSPKNAPPPRARGETGRGVEGPVTQLKLWRTLATANTLSPVGAGRSPTHQIAGETSSAGRDENGAMSEVSVARCDRVSSEEKT